jgi:NitT/TauT family transport system substrate-binding protein
MVTRFRRISCSAILSMAAITTLSLSASAQEKVSVRLRWVPQAQFAGIYVAEAKGFYKDVGLDMTINPGGPNINVETLVASGADPFGVASPGVV